MTKNVTEIDMTGVKTSSLREKRFKFKFIKTVV